MCSLNYNENTANVSSFMDLGWKSDNFQGTLELIVIIDVFSISSNKKSFPFASTRSELMGY